VNTSLKNLLRALSWAGILFLIALTGGCESNRVEPRYNVIVVLLDTFRADRMGTYGAKPGITPRIDQFAANGVVFSQAFSHAPWTLPSVASIFTSQVPDQHGAGGRMGAFKALPPEALTMAEVFQRHGARTGAISNVIFLTESFGAMQGFDTLDAVASGDNTTLRNATATTDAALEWIEKNDDQRFFLFVHYFDPHLKYDPPQPFRRDHAGAADTESGDFLFGSVADMLSLRRGERRLTRGLVTRLEKLYNGEIAYVDHEVGRLLSSLRDRGIDQNTIILLTADHGEEFLDHGGFEHGHALYDELLHVPLIVWEPGTLSSAPANAEPAQKIVRTTVRHVDVAPTLFELTGIPGESSFSGRSLASLLAGNHEPGRSVLSQGTLWGPGRNAFRHHGFKLIERSDSGSIQLFDVEDDPAEENDLSQSDTDEGSSMREELKIVLQSLQGGGTENEAMELDEQQRQQLRALGYLD
jgi:arylsulfatase A-like enzyme